jgi:hypothetical protein
MRCLTSILLLALASPTTAPSPDDSTKSTVEKLIAQLGAENFQDRESASNELLRIGPPILPLLRAAKSNDDPEIQTRLEHLIDQLHALAHAPPAATAIPIALAHLKNRDRGVLSARNPAPGQVELSATYGEDKVIMTRSAKGIEIHAECLVNGKRSRETYRAQTEHELKVQFPNAYELHEALLTNTYGEDRRWWRQFAAKAKPATQPARQ